MSSQHIQRLPAGFAPARRPLAGLRSVALNRVAHAGRALRAYFEDHAQGRADAALLAQAQRCEAAHPTLARELRSYVRGGSSY